MKNLSLLIVIFLSISCSVKNIHTTHQYENLPIALLRFEDLADNGLTTANINMLITSKDLLAIFEDYMQKNTGVKKNYYDITIKEINNLFYLQAKSEDGYLSTTSLHLINDYNKGGVIIQTGRITCTSRDCTDGSSCIPENKKCSSCSFLNDCVQTPVN